MTVVTTLTSTNVVLSAFLFLIILIVLRSYRRSRTTKFKGPPRKSFLFGYSNVLFSASQHSDRIEEWETQYGHVFQVPTVLGLKDSLVLCDPKAILHVYSNDTYTYRHTRSTRYFTETFFGRNLLWAEADTHKRQRKALVSAFSNSAIRNLTPVFYDSAYKVKSAWDSRLQSCSGNSFVVDVQDWISHVSLDTIGIAGFSHDFGSLKGKSPPVVAAFDSFGSLNSSASSMMVLFLSQMIPSLANIPTERMGVIKNVVASINSFAGSLLESARVEKGTDVLTDKSIIATLVRSEPVNSETSKSMSNDEIMAQAFLLVIAGYETTASMGFTESPHSEIQQKLRDELAQFSTEDPTWEQLTNGLPFLDAVVCEILRLHSAAPAAIREAHVDDVIPLSKSIQTADGQFVDSIFVAKDSVVYIPITAINRSEALWGKNAKVFDPTRWLDESISQQKASEIIGYRHLLTFGGGPRACLGRTFALTEFKVM
ncbi:cytochrome P450 [Tricholoma matsutake]|nr:cytochrome P450 [Tricholoma matsutake 945]